MKWFEGSINEAVATSKSKKAIFVVFVEGKDDGSTQFAQAINASEVSTRLEEETFVAIRLESGSETYRFFAQIYQLVPVPSLFFIGENGTPLEIVAGSVTASELASKIDSVLTKGGKSNKDSSTHLIEAEQKTANVNNVTDNSAPNLSHTSDNTPQLNIKETSEKASSDAVPEKNSTIKTDTKVEPSTSLQATETLEKKDVKEETPPKELTAEEKLERARQLIEVQRKQRLEEEERKEKERELERRKVGRDVQVMRQKQHELEVKLAHEERMKEKAAEAAARDKVRQQIAQDKLERKQKELALQQQMQQHTPEQPKPYTPVVTDATVTRIQFRLPSGNPHMGQFDPKSTLRALRTYVVENIDLPFRQFAMSTSFPRRDLTHEDDDKTLLDLELVPTAVILILPVKNSNVTTTVTSTQEVGFLSRLMWSVFGPLLGVYNYLMGYFSRGTQTNTERQRGDSTGARDNAGADGIVIPNLQNVANSAGLFRRNLSNQGGTSTRAEGNIHRLHSRRDDNDENNTWNGNSTQQM